MKLKRYSIPIGTIFSIAAGQGRKRREVLSLGANGFYGISGCVTSTPYFLTLLNNS